MDEIEQAVDAAPPPRPGHDPTREAHRACPQDWNGEMRAGFVIAYRAHYPDALPAYLKTLDLEKPKKPNEVMKFGLGPPSGMRWMPGAWTPKRCDHWRFLPVDQRRAFEQWVADEPKRAQQAGTKAGALPEMPPFGD